MQLLSLQRLARLAAFAPNAVPRFLIKRVSWLSACRHGDLGSIGGLILAAFDAHTFSVTVQVGTWPEAIKT
jgi:hypothetical protein